MADQVEPADRWDLTWEGSRRQALESARAATPAQRLAWLEEVLELAWRAGALATRPAGDPSRHSQ